MEHTRQHEKQTAPQATRHAASGKEPARPQPLTQLLQTAGNQAVQQLLRSGAVRAKLSISQPGDPEEQEADATADRIMRSHTGVESPDTSCSCGTDEEGMCDECRERAAGISRRAAGSCPSHATHSVVDTITRSSGRPLDAATRAFFEPHFGQILNQVRIHTDASAASSARSIQAYAFTAGNGIYFASGQYAPDSNSGRRLLAHELTHVSQGSRFATSGGDRVRRKYEGPYAFDPGATPSWQNLKGRDLDNTIWQKAFDATLSEAPQAALDVEADLQKTPSPSTDDEKAKAIAQIRTLIRLNALGLMASNRAGVDRKRDELLQQATSTSPTPSQAAKTDTATNAQAIRAAAKEAVALGQKKDLLQGSERRLLSESGSQTRTGGDSFTVAFKTLIDETAPYRSDDIRRYFAALRDNLSSTQSLDRGMQTALIFTMGRYLAEWRHRQIGGIVVAINGIYEQFPFLAQLAPEDVPQEGQATNEQLMDKVRGAFKDLLAKIDNAIIKIGAGDIDPFDLPEAVKATRDSLSPALKSILAQEIEHHQVVQFWTDMGLTLAQVVLVLIPVVGPALAAALGVGQLAASVGEMVDRYEIASASTSPDGGVLGVTGPSKLEWAMLGVQTALTAADLGGLWKEINAGRTHFTEAEPRLREEEEPGLAERKREGGSGEKKVESAESRPAGHNPDVDKIPGEDSIRTAAGGEARVTEEGFCKICHSPCEREVQMVRDLLGKALGGPYEGYVDNLLKRIEALERSMIEAKARGQLNKLVGSRFEASFRKLSNEIEVADRKLYGGGQELHHGAIEDIHAMESGKEHGIMDEPHVWDPERALAGTAFHEHIEEAVVAKLPRGTVYTENTIQDFLLTKGIARSELPARSTGMDLYIFDRSRGVVTPVDITGVGGFKGHVGKLMKDADKMRGLFGKAGFYMEEPFEIEYAGKTFTEASTSVVDELKALAK